MGIHQVSGQVYSWIFAGLSVGFIGASQLNSIVLRTYRSDQIVPIALLCQSVVSVVFLLGALLGWLGIASTIVLLFLYLCCIGFTNPNTSALSLAPFQQDAGSASALMGAIQMGTGALASFCVSLFDANSLLPMVGIMAASALGGLLLLHVGRRQIVNVVAGETQSPILH